MTSSSLTNPLSHRSTAVKVVLAAFALTVLAGCIADTAEDTDLPWASNRGWEGMAPISPMMTDRYE